MVFTNKIVVQNDSNGEFINLRGEDNDLDDGIVFPDESELDEVTKLRMNKCKW